MRKTICAGNWKLHKTPSETSEFLEGLVSELSIDEQSQYLVFPPSVCLEAAGKALHDSKVGWGAQNTFYERSGAYTGETSSEVVSALGATHILVGHSERRKIFGETDEEVGLKVFDIQSLGLTPVLCLGESLEQREAGETNGVISDQLRRGLLKADNSKEVVIAYEPVWAIGTGKVASPEQAEQAHQVLRNILMEIGGEELAENTSILYGGSVKPENAGELAAQANIDGFLIGGASLKLDSFLAIGRELSNH